MVAKEVRRKSSRSKALRSKNVGRKNVRRKTLRRKTLRRKTLRRKNVGRKTLRRKNMGRKTMRRKNVKRKTLRKGGGFFERIQNCFGTSCDRQQHIGESHIGELSTSTGVNVLTVTDYKPPTGGFKYYYEAPFNTKYDVSTKGDLNDSAAERLAFIIAQIKYGKRWRIHWKNLKSELIYTTTMAKYGTEWVDKYLDAGLSDKGFPKLSLLATKLLKYFDVEGDVDKSRREKPVTSESDHIPPVQQLKVDYSRGRLTIFTVESLGMKMKSYSEEENEELFNKGTAHMIAYLIYDYYTRGGNSDVSRFINET